MNIEDDESSTSSSSLSSLDIVDKNPDDKSRGKESETAKKRKAGRKKFKETRHPVYKGVRERNGGEWVCEVREPNKKSRIWLGTYPSAKMAARAHDVAALALRGEKAALNFSDSTWRLKQAKSSSPDDIRAAALQVSATSSFLSSNSFTIDFQDNTSLGNIVAPPEIGLGSHDGNVESSKRGRGLTCSVDSTSVVMQREDGLKPVAGGYVDEEVVFNMPSFYNSMAEGLVITPPAMEKGFDWDGDHGMDFNLWGD